MASGRGYSRGWLLRVLLAALTLLAIAVPEQLATSRLADMPPVTAYYAFIAGTVMFALLGSNPQMSVGADSTIAPLFAVGIGHLAATGSPRYIDLVGLLAVTVGAIVALVGILRLGWIAEFLSAPIITGFLAGVAVIIVVHQLPDLLGIPAAGGSTLDRLRHIAHHLGGINAWSLGIGLGVLALVVAGERLDRRLPGALVGVVAATVVVAGLGLRDHGVDTIGTFAHAAPRWGLAGVSWSALRSVMPLAAVVALLVISQSAATTRAFADEGGYEVDVSRDFVGVGAGSVMAGLAGSFPVNASPPRTAAVAAAGGRTQVSGLLAAGALAALVPASGLLKDLPVAALAAVLIFVAARIFHAREIYAIARYDAVEFALAAVGLLTVAFVGVQQGIGVAVALAIADRARLSARPQMHVLGLIPGTTSWTPVSGPERTEQVPGVLVVLFATPLWYANAANFRREMEQALKRAVGQPRAVVLDAIGMSDVDFTGARALREVLDELEGRHLMFGVARAGERVRSNLDRAGLLERIGEDRFYPTVGEAVDGLLC
ncbi:MAG TPA: SulP family inorganic anion transporter [Acidimicrobiales bacterium]|nr:SulP family inorganic anion transporter [Acidimicrobiales bacterium]